MRVRIGMWLRWSARIISALTILLFLVFGIGEGIGSWPAKGLTREEAALMLATGVMIAGVAIAFWRELTGAGIAVVGYALFTAVDGDFNLDNPFIAFPVIAILYGLSWMLRRPSGSPARSS